MEACSAIPQPDGNIFTSGIVREHSGVCLDSKHCISKNVSIIDAFFIGTMIGSSHPSMVTQSDMELAHTHIHDCFHGIRCS